MRPTTREAELEAALVEVLREATAARAALCEQELLVRLENIARYAEAALRGRDGTPGHGC